jgi:predicted dehydrogenase/threonine dehydrogenase-like Zn-dependent dehydrogenase
MKQILQNLRTGETSVAEIPRPNPAAGHLLIQTRCSLVSSGTERSLVEFGAAGWLEKARQQPDKVRMVLEKARTDGLAATIDAVLRKLEQPLPMGYCNVGEVVAVGSGLTAFSIGDRVVSNGKHAEFVSVPANLCARIPSEVNDEAAAFTVLGAIALQGIRLANPTLGESFVVMGLGLVGLLTVQLLKAHGCRVLGLDLDRDRASLARDYGVEALVVSQDVDPLRAADRFSKGRGVDGVLITASTKSSEPVHQAAVMSRKRGRIVLVGVAGLDLSRADFYEKELSFQVSCSYGPGRYDPEYEEKGHDYPIGYVRWTEQRNLEAVLDMFADGRLDVSGLVANRFPIEQAAKAYELISTSASSLGVLFDYPSRNGRALETAARTVQVAPIMQRIAPALGFIGAGNYASGILIPAFSATSVRLKAVSSANGISGTHAAKKFGIELSTTDSASILADPEISAIIVTTRHASHADWVLQGLAAGKHVFVEKPLAITSAQLAAIADAYEARIVAGRAPVLMVGFNRRFAPHIAKIEQLLQAVRGPKSFVMTVNAGSVPRNHWTQDPEVGGGRLIGEACHFIDLLRFLADSPISGVHVAPLRDADCPPIPDTCTICLSFVDGSVGNINYFANGHKALPKERLEVFAQGKVIRLHNFRKLETHGWPGAGSMRLWRQDKGQRACAASFVRAIETGVPPIPFDQLIEVARVTIEASEAARAA